ncbi:uncharacterized protein IWZ02DRAFT_118342 [Phyllosticta citriasiana]|uniref:uncharacterized protein n=1 Tax=Phyllosticta citriasiana TaxID=595635 RepID=UPI0030FDE30F
MLVFFLFCFESVRYAGSAWAFCGLRIRMRMDAQRHQLCALSLFSSRHFISSSRLFVRLVLLRVCHSFIKPCSCCRYRRISTKKAPPQGDTFSLVRVSIGRYSLGCCFLFFRSSFLPFCSPCHHHHLRNVSNLSNCSLPLIVSEVCSPSSSVATKRNHCASVHTKSVASRESM